MAIFVRTRTFLFGGRAERLGRSLSRQTSPGFVLAGPDLQLCEGEAVFALAWQRSLDGGAVPVVRFVQLASPWARAPGAPDPVPESELFWWRP